MPFVARPSLSVFAVCCLLAVGCTASRPSNSGPSALSVEADPTNTLQAVVQFSGNVEEETVLEIASETARTRTVSLPGPPEGDGYVVSGLRAETEYTFTIVDSRVDAVSFTTGPLPLEAPSVEIVRELTEGEGEQNADGVTFFGLPPERGRSSGEPTYFGADADGEIVWYLADEDEPNRDPVIRNLNNGELLVFFANSVKQVTLAGDVVEVYDLSKVDGWHHEAILLPDGGLLALGRETQELDGEAVLGDTIVELDEDGEVIWEWSTFDHLDTGRYPGPLSERQAVAGGGIDWSHSNSLYYDAASEQILLSVRSQNWVVAIDKTSGELDWIAGEEDGADADFDAPFLALESGEWASGQHTAGWTEAGELILYDNANETTGEEQGSRAVIYEVDQAALTATQVFEHRVSKFTASLGDVDELPNGNILITAGGPGSDDVAQLVEVTRDGTEVWQGAVDGRIYRSERVVWAEMVAIQRAHSEKSANDESGAQPPGEDITGRTLVSTDSDCASYIGEFRSKATDRQTDRIFVGELVITADDQVCEVTSNQIPNHDIALDAEFPNEVQEVEATFTISKDPRVEETVTELGFTAHAILLNGILWEAYPAACFDEGNGRLGQEAVGCGGNQLDHPWRYNIGSPLNSFALDRYSAHAQATGLYHYHSTPVALHDTECEGSQESPVIGFARDGFPIYGPCFADEGGAIRRAQSSYQLKNGVRETVDGFTTPYVIGNVATETYNGQFIGDYGYQENSGDLDRCNGMVVNGQYGYYLTDTYPYVLACYSGTPSVSFGAEASPKDGRQPGNGRRNGAGKGPAN